MMMTMKITLMLIQRSSLSNSVLMLYMTGCKTTGYVSTRLKLMSLCSQSSVNWSVHFWFCHANIIDCQKPRSHTRPFAVLWPACCECLQFVLQPHPSTSTIQSSLPDDFAKMVACSSQFTTELLQRTLRRHAWGQLHKATVCTKHSGSCCVKMWQVHSHYTSSVWTSLATGPSKCCLQVGH